jgi:uncharacterized protein YdgA (DUF945 family)
VKKAIVIVCALLVIVPGAWLGAAYYFGVRSERTFSDALRRVGEAVNLNVSTEEYHRGLLVSRAKTAVEINLPVKGGENKAGSGEIPKENSSVRLVLVHRIYHGPFPFTSRFYKEKVFPHPIQALVETGIEAAPDTSEPLKRAFEKIPELAATKSWTVIDMKGNGESLLDAPPFKREFEAGGSGANLTVAWKGLTYRLRFSPQREEYLGSLLAPALDVSAKDGALSIAGIESSLNVHRGTSGIFVGDSTFGISNVHFSEKKEKPALDFSIANLQMKSHGQEAGPDLDYSLIMTMESLLTRGASWGPAGFELDLRKINADAFVKLQAALEELQLGRSGISEDETLKMLTEKFVQFGPGLFKDSPELELKQLSLKTDKGDFTGGAKIGFDGLDPKEAGNLVKLVSSLYATAEVNVAESLVRNLLANTLDVGEIASTGGSGRDSADQPAMESPEESGSEAAKEPMEQSARESAEASVKQSAEDSTEQSAEQAAKDSAEQSAKQPVEQPAGQSPEQAAARMAALIDQKVNELVQEKVFIRENGILKATAAYKNGVVTLNGVDLPLASLLQ